MDYILKTSVFCQIFFVLLDEKCENSVRSYEYDSFITVQTGQLCCFNESKLMRD